MVLDELQAITRTDIYPALASALHKRQDSKLIVISTAAQGVDSALGQLRQRALGLRDVSVRGALTDAHGPGLRMLEWSVPQDRNVDAMRELRKANPASWLTLESLKEQRERLSDLAFRRFVANQWVSGLTEPASTRCVGPVCRRNQFRGW